jgi:hypothetical protein
VFEKAGGTWSQVAKLTASDGIAEDFFGRAVSIAGSTVIVGAYGDDDRGGESGSAYVFEKAGGAWTQAAKLTASDGAAGDNFGNAISMSDSTAIIGAYADDDMGDNSGSAYVLEKRGGTWGQVAKLTASDGSTWDNFGKSLAVSDATAIVGAFGDDDAGSNSGAAYIFRGAEVNVSSDDETEAAVPPTVSIPVGQTSASFAISPVDDLLLDGTQTVTITVSAAGWTSGSDTLDVTDDEAPGWQNPANRFDVDGDGSVKPLDVLVLINWINLNPGATRLPDLPAQPPPFLDVNDDNACTAADVLALTNELNRPSTEAGEGEAEQVGTVQAGPDPVGGEFQDLAARAAFDALSDRRDALLSDILQDVAAEWATLAVR